MKTKALSIFFLLAYALFWLLWSPLWLPFFGIKAEPFLPYQHGFGGLGPMLAAFLTTAMFNGKPETQLLWKRLFQGKPLMWTAIAGYAISLIFSQGPPFHTFPGAFYGKRHQLDEKRHQL